MAIAWAGLSKVDDVAEAHGKLIPDEEVQPVRSPSSGKIKYINETASVITSHHFLSKYEGRFGLHPLRCIRNLNRQPLAK